jgi:transaldolase
MYVEELIGPDTVNTMPLATIEAFEDHGRVERTIDKDIAGAYETIRALEALGISMKDVTDTLQVEGVKLFADSLESLYRCIEVKREVLLPARTDRTGRGSA